MVKEQGAPVGSSTAKSLSVGARGAIGCAAAFIQNLHDTQAGQDGNLFTKTQEVCHVVLFNISNAVL